MLYVIVSMQCYSIVHTMLLANIVYMTWGHDVRYLECVVAHSYGFDMTTLPCWYFNGFLTWLEALRTLQEMGFFSQILCY